MDKPERIKLAWAAEIEACDKAIADGKGVAIPCRDTSGATALRMHFYRFRQEWRAQDPGGYDNKYDVLAFTAKGDELHIKVSHKLGSYETKSLG